MKVVIHLPTEVEISAVEINVPVRFGDEDMPYDFPLRTGDTWRAVVDIDTGKIRDWPSNQSGKVYLKVCDAGAYRLLDNDNQMVAMLAGYYVPHGVIPGDCGDYIRLDINSEGVIVNWPKNPDISKFINQD